MKTQQPLAGPSLSLALALAVVLTVVLAGLVVVVRAESASTACPSGYTCRSSRSELQQLCEERVGELHAELATALKEHEFYPEVDCGDSWYPWMKEKAGHGVCRGRIRVRSRLAGTGLAASWGLAFTIYNIRPETIYPFAKRLGITLDYVDDWVPLLKPISWGIAGVGTAKYVIDRVPHACDHLPGWMCSARKPAASTIETFYLCSARAKETPFALG